MKTKRNIINLLKASLLLSIVCAIPSSAMAAPYATEKLPDATVYNDFVVGPGKYQVEMKPGESKIVNMIVTNRLGKEKTCQVQTEDFFSGVRHFQHRQR